MGREFKKISISCTGKKTKWEKNLLEFEGSFVQIEGSPVAFSDVKRDVSGVESFNHGSSSLLNKIVWGYYLKYFEVRIYEAVLSPIQN